MDKIMECKHCNGTGLIETDDLGTQECPYCEFGWVEEPQ